jgi:hypothetical protein
VSTILAPKLFEVSLLDTSPPPLSKLSPLPSSSLGLQNQTQFTPPSLLWKWVQKCYSKSLALSFSLIKTTLVKKKDLANEKYN